MKKCKRCGKNKSITRFPKHRKNNALMSICNSCKELKDLGDTLAGHKTCSGCNKMKPVSQYYRRKDGKSETCSRCKTCMDTSFRDRSYRTRFGITLAEYESLLEEQSSRCRLCGEKEKIDNRIKNLAVDHDHKTGKVRGLLCNRCNRALGMFSDDINFLKKAIAYLQNSDYHTN